jgi:hypothetical protein
MTTAFAYTVRARLDLAWNANPAGLLFCLTCGILAPWALVCAGTGRAWVVRSLDDLLIRMTLIGITLALASWAFRLLSGRFAG